MSDPAALPQLQMVWPQARLSTPPVPHLPPGYTLRTYRPGDEARFYEVMALSGWPGWDDEKLRPWLARILPASWFMVIHTASDQMVATAMGLHDPTDWHPFGGELGWVASDPAHAGQGLGRAVCAAVVDNVWTRYIWVLVALVAVLERRRADAPGKVGSDRVGDDRAGDDHTRDHRTGDDRTGPDGAAG